MPVALFTGVRKTALGWCSGVRIPSASEQQMIEMQSLLLAKESLRHGLRATFTAKLPAGGFVTVELSIPGGIHTLSLAEVQDVVLSAAITQLQTLREGLVPADA